MRESARASEQERGTGREGGGEGGREEEGKRGGREEGVWEGEVWRERECGRADLCDSSVTVFSSCEEYSAKSIGKGCVRSVIER